MYITDKAHLFHGTIKYNYTARRLAHCWSMGDDNGTMHNDPIKTNY